MHWFQRCQTADAVSIHHFLCAHTASLKIPRTTPDLVQIIIYMTLNSEGPRHMQGHTSYIILNLNILLQHPLNEIYKLNSNKYDILQMKKSSILL